MDNLIEKYKRLLADTIAPRLSRAVDQNVGFTNGRWNPVAQVGAVLNMNQSQAQDYRQRVDNLVPKFQTPDSIGNIPVLGGISRYIAQPILNAPSEAVAGMARLPAARTWSQGIGDTASVANLPLTIASMGAAPTIAKTGAQLGFKQAVKQGALSGMKWGGSQGAVQGLIEGRDAGLPMQLATAAGSGLIGAGVGGAVGGLSAGGGSLVGEFYRRLNPASSLARDDLGRFKTTYKPSEWVGGTGTKSKYNKKIKINDDIKNELGLQDNWMDPFKGEGGYIKLGASPKSQQPVGVSESSTTSISRGFPERVQNSPMTPKAVADDLKANPLNYSPLKNATVVKEVTNKILKKGDSYALQVARDGNDTNSNAAALLMMEKMIKQGRYDEVNQLIRDVSPRFTEQGQQIQILSMYGKLNPTGAVKFAQNLINQANKGSGANRQIKLSPEQTEIIVKAAESIQKLQPDSREYIVAVAKLMKEISGTIPPSLGQRISTIQTMAQLLNPKTGIRNVLGNAIFGAAENVSDIVGAGLDTGISLATGQRSKAFPNLGAQAKGLARGAKEGFQDAMLGIDTSGGVATQLDLPQTTFRGKYNPLTYLEKAMNITLRTPDRALYTAAREGSLASQMKAAGVTAPTKEMLEIAHQDGLYRTFQDKSRLAELFTGTKRLLNKAGTPDGSFGLGDFILKYPKTPANILSRGLDYSPAGFLKGLYEATRPIISGTPFNQKAFVEDLSRAMVGTGLISAGYTLAEKGILTGKGEKDSDINATIRADGGGPFRINLDALNRFLSTGNKQENQANDTVVSFDWAQPSSIQLAMGANFYTRPKGTDGLTSLIEQLDAGASTLTGQGMVKGLTDFTSDVGRDGPIAAVTNSVAGAPASFIPSAVNQVTQLQDNQMRETYDADPIRQGLNRAVAKIPGQSNNLPQRYTVLGQPMERYQDGGNNIFNVLFNPAFVSKIKSNPVANEVLALYNQTGETSQAPRQAPRTVTINGSNLKLNGEQISQYQRYIGTATNDLVGQLVDTPEYQKLDEATRVKTITNLLSDINSAAKIDLFGHNPKNVSKATKLILANNYNSAPINIPEGSIVRPSQQPTIEPSSPTTGIINKLTGTEIPRSENLSPTSELSKKLLSAQSSKLTRMMNDVVDSYRTGAITADEAERQLVELKQQQKALKVSTGKAKVGKKIKPIKISIPKAKKVKAVSSKVKKIRSVRLAKIKVKQKGTIRLT